MTAYVRPHIESVDCYDDAGNLIPYGERWEGSPPEHTYSAVTHPERFSPLRLVADALIDHLTQTYEVEVQEGLGLLAAIDSDLFLVPEADSVDRAIRLVPSDPDCAPITFIYTSSPTVYVLAGIFADFLFPSCGCDACDETWEGGAEAMEDAVLAIVTGKFKESVRLNPLRKISYQRGMGICAGMGRSYG